MRAHRSVPLCEVGIQTNVAAKKHEAKLVDIPVADSGATNRIITFDIPISPQYYLFRCSVTCRRSGRGIVTTHVGVLSRLTNELLDAILPEDVWTKTSVSLLLSMFWAANVLDMCPSDCHGSHAAKIHASVDIIAFVIFWMILVSIYISTSQCISFRVFWVNSLSSCCRRILIFLVFSNLGSLFPADWCRHSGESSRRQILLSKWTKLNRLMRKNISCFYKHVSTKTIKVGLKAGKTVSKHFGIAVGFSINMLF